jgi:hypothetical protein
MEIGNKKLENMNVDGRKMTVENITRKLFCRTLKWSLLIISFKIESRKLEIEN